MVHNVQNLCLFFVIFIVYSSYSYAPVRSIWNSAPVFVPPSDFKQNCLAWLEFHELVANDIAGERSNKSRADARNKLYDREMHVWASCYAYILTSFSVASLTMQRHSTMAYCERFNIYNVASPYLSLKNTVMTCHEWIFSYGYHKNNQFLFNGYTNSSINAYTLLNVHMALHRKKENDNVPHLLVAMYSSYVEDMIEVLRDLNSRHPLAESHSGAIKTPLEFCEYLDNTEEDPMWYPFATLDSKMICKRWIESSGYTNDIGHNIQKARRQNMEVKQYHSKWTIEYINYLHTNEPSMTPEKFCIYIKYPNIVEVFYKRDSYDDSDTDE